MSYLSSFRSMRVTSSLQKLRAMPASLRGSFFEAAERVKRGALKSKLMYDLDIIEYKLSEIEDENDVNVTALRKSAARISPDILSLSSIIHVLPEERFSNMHRFIVSKEAVHKLAGGVKELIKYRLGLPGTNKDCQALHIKRRGFGDRLFSQIFRYHSYVPQDEQGRIDVTKLPGNVDYINSLEPQELQGDENVTGYYTVSADMLIKGAARALVSRLWEANPEGRLETTISPVREMEDEVARVHILGIHNFYGAEAARKEVLRYLSKKEDPVANFHLGNGAMIGWIHFNSDSPKDWVTINYVYDRDMLEANKAISDAGKLPVTPALYRETGVGEVVESKRLMPLSMSA